jgi:hypothetical protein
LISICSEENKVAVAIEALTTAYKSKYVFEHIRNPFTRSYEYADMPQIEHQSEEDRHRRGTYYAVLKRIEFNKAFFEHVWEI